MIAGDGYTFCGADKITCAAADTFIIVDPYGSNAVPLACFVQRAVSAVRVYFDTINHLDAVFWRNFDAGAAINAIINIYFIIKIAKITAFCLLKRKVIAEPGFHFRHEHDKLLMSAYGQLGATDKQAVVAQRIFDRNCDIDSLDQLIALVGEDRRDAIIEEAALHIAGGELSTGGVQFLLDLGRDEDAERHILEHRSELNGEFYTTLLKIAKRLRSEEHTSELQSH